MFLFSLFLKLFGFLSGLIFMQDGQREKDE